MTEMTKRTNLIAFDRKSARSYDVDGRLEVVNTNISKACVNPYWGREINDNERLGLDPNKIYYLYRDPVELEKAAATFNNVQLLYRHETVSVDDPQIDEIVGSVGNAHFEAPYLKANLRVWRKKGVVAIENKELNQLSCSYHYRADMTPGVTATGERFDGVIRDIEGNHVALVREGRAGPDVVVADEKPVELTLMRCKKIIDSIKDFLPRDTDLLALDSILARNPAALDEAPEEEESGKAKDKKAKDKKAKDKKAKDTDGTEGAEEHPEEEGEDEDVEEEDDGEPVPKDKAKDKKAKDKKAKDRKAKDGDEEDEEDDESEDEDVEEEDDGEPVPKDKAKDKKAKDKKAKDRKAKDGDEEDEDEDESAADSFNELVEKLVKRGYSKESATKIAGKVAAEKGDDRKAADAMNEALAAAVAYGREQAEALATARVEVEPVVGRVALDSAEAVYKYALEDLGEDLTGVHPSAYRSILKRVLKHAKQGSAASTANDSATAVDFGFDHIKILG